MIVGVEGVVMLCLKLTPGPREVNLVEVSGDGQGMPSGRGLYLPIASSLAPDRGKLRVSRYLG